MPLVTINVLENVFSDLQKKEIIERVTDTLASIEGESMRSLIWVVIDEVPEGNWGVGGQALNHDP
ncbi:MAG: 4-oxalocrotonate tautomerase family protein [Gammaproteobacteria bacterium]|nr:4-oxalocrotonate tautomerase family protein [Gammaproteobacteria bacterium]